MNKLYLLLCFISCSALAQQQTVKDAFLEKWSNSQDYLISVAEAMPEEKYNFKPTERQMDFANQLLHIRENMLWLGTTYFSETPFDRQSLRASVPQGKKATIAALNKAFDTVYAFAKATSDEDLKTTINFFAGPKSKLQILNLLQDHVTHHRAQLIVYLNINAIEPPGYVGW